MSNFWFSTETEKKTSYFQLIFHIDNVKYRYGFEINENEVYNEWLYVTRHRETPVFIREGQNVNVTRSHMETGYDIANMKSKLLMKKFCF